MDEWLKILIAALSGGAAGIALGWLNSWLSTRPLWKDEDE